MKILRILSLSASLQEARRQADNNIRRNSRRVRYCRDWQLAPSCSTDLNTIPASNSKIHPVGNILEKGCAKNWNKQTKKRKEENGISPLEQTECLTRDSCSLKNSYLYNWFTLNHITDSFILNSVLFQSTYQSVFSGRMLITAVCLLSNVHPPIISHTSRCTISSKLQESQCFDSRRIDLEKVTVLSLFVTSPRGFTIQRLQNDGFIIHVAV